MIGTHRPKKSLGQNFLTDPNYKRKILDAVLAKADSPVLEIGGGRGILTEELAARAPHLCVVEKDHRLAEFLREKFRENSKVEVVCEDFLKLVRPSPSMGEGQSEGGRITVIGNLPYNIASQIFIRLIENRKLFSELFLMFQKEMALRFVAKPRTKDYGLLTLWAQLYTEPKILFHLPATAFFPRPKVSSSFIHFTIKEHPLITDEESPRFWKTMRTLFQKRRKTIRSALGKGHPAAREKWGTQRAEELSVPELIALSRSTEKLTGPSS